MINYLTLPIGDIDCLIKTNSTPFLYMLQKEFYLNRLRNKKEQLILDADKFIDRLKPTGPLILKKRIITEVEYKGFILTAFLERLVLDKNIFFLHGSAFFKKNHAYIFIGLPGMGKTTIIKKIPIKNRLSDDTSVIKKINNSFVVYYSPFDKKNIHFKNNCFVPLKKIFVLRQAYETEINRISVKNKLYHLVLNNYYFMNKTNINKIYPEDEIKEKKLIGFFFQLIARVNIDELKFTKECRFLERLF